jgi:hypothetical protein
LACLFQNIRQLGSVSGAVQIAADRDNDHLDTDLQFITASREKSFSTIPFSGVTTMEGLEFKIEPKNIDEMVAALKKGAKSKGFDFKGDSKSGSATNAKALAAVTYTVKDKSVTVRGEVTGWDLNTLEQLMREWFKPYR